MLRDLTDRLRSPSLYVTASLLLKQYSYCLLMPTLYAMTLLDKGLGVGGTTACLKSLFPGKALAARFAPEGAGGVSRLPEGSDRAFLAGRIVGGGVRRDDLAKVIRTVSQVSGLSPTVLYGKYASIYFYWMYETYMPGKAGEEKRSRINEDFRYLLSAQPSLFGERKNPLKRFFCEKCCLPGC